jgi:hypothetical protein
MHLDGELSPRSRKRCAELLDVGPRLRPGREVHPVAGSASGRPPAGRRDAIRAGRKDFEQVAACGSLGEVDLGEHAIAWRRLGNEHGAALTAAVHVTDSAAAWGERRDSHFEDIGLCLPRLGRRARGHTHWTLITSS